MTSVYGFKVYNVNSDGWDVSLHKGTADFFKMFSNCVPIPDTQEEVTPSDLDDVGRYVRLR